SVKIVEGGTSSTCCPDLPLQPHRNLRHSPPRTSCNGFRRRRVWNKSSTSSLVAVRNFKGIRMRTPPANSEDTSGSRSKPTGSSTKRGKINALVKKAAFRNHPAQKKKLPAVTARKNLCTQAASSKPASTSDKDLQGQHLIASSSQPRTYAPPVLLRSDPGKASPEVEFGMVMEAAMELQSADASSSGAQRAGLATVAMPNTSSHHMVARAASVPPSVPAQGSKLLQELSNIFKTLINSNTPGVANTQISTGVHENSYKDVFLCKATPLGLYLPSTVKEKILKGDYIDMLSLLPSVKEFLKSERKGDSEEERHRPVARTFTNWLQAFCIYSNILCEWSPNLGPGLFKHLDIILEAYRSYGGVVSFLDDDRVRQKMAVHKSMLWRSKDIDLWMGMLAPKRQSVENQCVAGRNACWSFNENFCKWQNNCRYKHECSICAGAHPAFRCAKRFTQTGKPNQKEQHQKSDNTSDIAPT
ncbi:hypothetical protein XELAEV_18026617mg, partial [Xenopus laevis]